MDSARRGLRRAAHGPVAPVLVDRAVVTEERRGIGGGVLVVVERAVRTLLQVAAAGQQGGRGEQAAKQAVHGGLDAPRIDNALSIANLAAGATYIYLAVGPVYGATGAGRVTKAIVLAVAVAAIVLGYRFLLFLITLYGT